MPGPTVSPREPEDELTRVVQRLQVEKAELTGRLERLNAWIHTNPKFDALAAEDRELLVRQNIHMQRYRDVLNTRLQRLMNPRSWERDARLLRDALALLVGASTRAELDAMAAVLQTMPASENRTACERALQALRETATA